VLTGLIDGKRVVAIARERGTSLRTVSHQIVPAANPYSVAIGGTLTVQVLFRGKPLARQAIAAANRFHGDIQPQRLRTDAQGRATFRIDCGGDWMIRLVHMEPSDRPGADWRSWWTSLTFSLAE
jgi:uncharacterized GH25 family protein